MLVRKGHRGVPARAFALGCAAVVTGSLLTAGPVAAAESSAPVYLVTREGLTAGQSKLVADAFGIGDGLLPDGSFAFASEAFGKVGTVDVGQGRDEQERPTVAQALDLAALDKIKVLPDDDALGGAKRLAGLLVPGTQLEPEPEVSHTQLTLTDANDRVTRVQPLDTTVSFAFTLGGLPVTGQGSKLRLTFAPDGSVSELSSTLRQLKRGDDVPIISVDEATKACATLYDAEVRQSTPTLGYPMPALTATDASGKGTVSTIYPQYTCNPVAKTGTLAHRLVPAVPDAAPTGKVTASRSGNRVTASVSVAGGTGPYTIQWSSSTTTLDSDSRNQPKIAYDRTPRDQTKAERVSVEVTDANGLVASAWIDLPGDGTASTQTNPGGGGYGALAVGPVDVGIEQTVDEWQCAQDSAIGFRNVMTAHGVGVAFDWRGTNAWEWDFKDPSLGGGDSSYVDNVDAVWYTGHGWPGGFTFKSSVTDTQIVPGDARWGNRDLEWLQLESCQVLRDTSGTHDYFSRWGPTFQGLHILNGFHTNAYCVSGGTGGTFAGYLFKSGSHPAYPVRTAWALMALHREPTGVVYRSMGLIRSDGVTNIGDYFWGQGATGPDILPSQSNGKWSITGTV